MAGRQASSTVTRYAGIQVQSSSLGLQIPMGGGTFRGRCNLVDYLDFTSTAQKASTGKGGGSTTTGYSYTATIILAICEGQIDGITQVWIDAKNFANGSIGSNVPNTGSTSALAQAGLSLNTGAVGQSVWSYLLSAHADHAIGYSGLAIAYAENYALDSSASPPNHSFEVVRTSPYAVGGGYAGPDIDPSLWIADFFQNTRTGVPSWGTGLLDATSLAQYQAYCLASGLLISPVIDQERSASDALTEYLLATNSNVVWSEGLLKFIPYGDTALTGNGATYTPNLTPVYSLDDDDFVADNPGDPPLLVQIEDQTDAYNVVQLEYLDRTNQYNMAIALASDAANVAQFQMRRQDPTTVHCICTPTVAALSATLYLQRTLYIRAQYTFKLSWAFALLEPGDIVELTDPGLALNAYPVRIIQLDEDDKTGVLELTCEDLLVGVSHSPLYTMQTGLAAQPNTGIDAGGVEANLLIQSQDWTNAAWAKTSLTITAAALANPVTGATDAQKAVAPAASSSHRAVQSGIAVFAGANYVLSAYFKPNGYNFGLLRVSQSGGATNAINAVFDLSGGVVSSTSAIGSAVIIATSITPVGSAWFRCSLTFQTGDTAIQVDLRPLPTSAVANYTGDGVSGCYLWGSQLTQGVDLRPYTLTTTAISGPLIFNPPTALTPGGLQTWAALAGGPNWAGANVWLSYDGTNYTLIGSTTQGRARFGTLTASLASHADPDTADTLSVDLSASNGLLTSATQATTDAGGTRCLVGAEMIGFEVATLTNPNRYNLTTYLRRGMSNTVIAAHSAGDSFIRLDEAIFTFPYDAQQAGRTATVKFQSFNQWGLGVTPLSNCVAYSTVPTPATGSGPATSAWTVTATPITGGGVNIPALLITGACDNLNATSIEFFYRPTGTSRWISAGFRGVSTTSLYITAIQSGTTYDVGVAYLVGGVLTPIVLATGSGSGTTGGGGSGGGVGTALVNTSVTGPGGGVALGGSGYTHVDIILTGYAGAGNGTGSGKGGFTDRGGGGGMVVVVKGFPATPTTVISWNLAASAVNSTCTGTGLSLTAKPGADATTGASGAGGVTTGVTNTATGSTSVTNYAGRNGGLTDIWDGGGPGATIDIASGTVTNPGPDMTFDFSNGSIPGQGGAGMSNNPLAGGGANILIIART